MTVQWNQHQSCHGKDRADWAGFMSTKIAGSLSIQSSCILSYLFHISYVSDQLYLVDMDGSIVMGWIKEMRHRKWEGEFGATHDLERTKRFLEMRLAEHNKQQRNQNDPELDAAGDLLPTVCV